LVEVYARVLFDSRCGFIDWGAGLLWSAFPFFATTKIEKVDLLVMHILLLLLVTLDTLGSQRCRQEVALASFAATRLLH
jgi:hypothetical protein